MQAIDQAVLNFFVTHRTEWLTFFMLVITYAGSFLVVSGLIFLSAISFYIQKHTARILPLLATVCGSATTTYLFKNIFSRARPIGAIYPEIGFSFPSGHATAAMALYGFLLYTIWKHEKRPLKKPLIVFLSVLIILLGISRLYLGVHYFSDVLAGYAVGFVWLLLGIKLHQFLLRLEWFKMRISQ